MKLIKVSVVVPIYNAGKYLRECLDSIKSQSLREIEVICVDDGSKDDSFHIVQEYAKKDSRFIAISKTNGGYGDSVNHGFNLASGEYVGIVESDDYIESDMFESLYRAAKTYACEIVKSDYYEFTTNDKLKQNYIRTPTDLHYYNIVMNYKTTIDIFHFRMNTWTGIYLNSFVRKNKITHNATPGAAYQDNGFWFQTISLAERIMFIDHAFYHYRQDNPNSSINSKSKVYCMCDEYKYIESFLERNPELHRDLFHIFLIKKYYNYMYTYNRIGDEYKVKFLSRFAEEYKGVLDDNLLNEENTDCAVLQILRRVVKSPQTFYYEDTIWNIQHDAAPLAKELDKISGNKFYEMLHKLRLI